MAVLTAARQHRARFRAGAALQRRRAPAGCPAADSSSAAPAPRHPRLLRHRRRPPALPTRPAVNSPGTFRRGDARREPRPALARRPSRRRPARPSRRGPRSAGRSVPRPARAAVPPYPFVPTHHSFLFKGIRLPLLEAVTPMAICKTVRYF